MYNAARQTYLCNRIEHLLDISFWATIFHSIRAAIILKVFNLLSKSSLLSLREVCRERVVFQFAFDACYFLRVQ